MTQGIRNTIESVWQSVNIGEPDACWWWTKYCNHDGYGRMNLNWKTYSAHRLAWESKYGSIPNKMCVLHKCDNPPCCNPAHLFLGTQKDNNNDRACKGRNANRKGSRHPLSKLTDVSVQTIRQSCISGRALARRYNVSEATISMVRHRVSWRHI